MTILEFFEQNSLRQAYWTERISEGDWRAAVYLAELLKENKFGERYGANGQVLLLTEGDSLVAFCTLVRQDEIMDDSLFPWIGFVYTFPRYRGHRYSQKLIDHACTLAKAQGHTKIYLSSDEHGLYEKYGFIPWRQMQTLGGETTQVFIRAL
ncbi:MAG: GNAT family N-acetyltransferase [Oscillospiraceae bacterium]|nr:GNAT family N-acetyltransferase [Oscillospiraceae bacterium]